MSYSVSPPILQAKLLSGHRPAERAFMPSLSWFLAIPQEQQSSQHKPLKGCNWVPNTQLWHLSKYLASRVRTPEGQGHIMSPSGEEVTVLLLLCYLWGHTLPVPVHPLNLSVSAVLGTWRYGLAPTNDWLCQILPKFKGIISHNQSY